MEVPIMKERKIRIYFNAEERRLLLQSLVELKNQVIQQGGYGDCIDEIIFKVASARVKKVKIQES